MLAVAATDSWNPTDHTSAGSSTSSTTTAPARIEPVLLGRPSRTPISASPAITPARITEGSAPVSTTKNATVPIPSANRGHRDHPSAAPSATIGASTIATFSPDTTSRWESPVARKSRSRPGSSRESSPSASPISSPASRGGNEDSIERPASARNDCAHRTGANAAGPRRSASSTSSSAAIPRRSRKDANPTSSTGRTEPETRSRSPRTASGGSSRPESHTVSRTLAPPVPSDRTDVQHRGPPIELDRRVDAERTLDGDRTRDPREHRVEDPMLVHAPPPDRQQERTRERERERRPDRSVVADRRGGDRGPEIARRRGDEPGALERRTRLRATGRERQRRPQQPAAGRQPDPRVDELADPWLHQQAGPEHGRERRCDRGAHTVTRSRMFSSVASPIPLTSSSWSTEVNGPFSVR